LSELAHIHIIDDDASIRSSLTRMLKSCGYAVDAYDSSESFLVKSIPASPATILLDVRMPSASGVDLQKKLNEMGRKTPIIFISGDAAPGEIVTGMKQGAIDFLFKPFNLDDLLRCIRLAIDKDIEIFQTMIQSLTINQRYESLTPREKEVCALLVKGLMNKDVAVCLGTTDATIKVHKSRVMDKMKASSLQELVRLFDLVDHK